ncbi:hypothetical protein BDZ45DRAFT_728620 [Acephala macrosclerotiorum]|nr:hypothetical protein BDZ45DRAFT_728620 [Acephala macrosclerotiorum]
MSSITKFLRNCASKKIQVACDPVNGDANEVMPTQPNNPVMIGSSPTPERFEKSCASNDIRFSKPDNEAKGFQVRSFSEPPPTTTNRLTKVVGDWDSPKPAVDMKKEPVDDCDEPLTLRDLKVGTLKDSMWSDKNYKATLAAQAAEKLAKLPPSYPPKPAVDTKKTTTRVAKNEHPAAAGTASRAPVPFNYYREQDAKQCRAKYDGSAQMAAWSQLSKTIQKDDARAAAEADAWKAKMLAEDTTIEAAGVRDIWNERHEGSTKKTGRKIIQVVGSNGEPINATILMEQFLSLSSVVGGGKPELIAGDVKGGVKGLTMWMSEVSAYLNGREFAAAGVVVPSIWRILPILFPNVKEMVVVLDTFTMGIPKREKLADIAGHRIAKSEQQRMDEITASFREAGFKNVKLTFKVLVDGNGERDEMYLM